MDKASLTVWLDNRAVLEREFAGRLCRRHANALVVPRGWTLDDRRESIPRLFKALAEEVAAQSQATNHSKAAKKKSKGKPKDDGSVVEAPTLFESAPSNETGGVSIVSKSVTAEAVNVPQTVDPDETQAIPWSPRLGASSSTDDDGDAAPVFGRLLGRAFGQKHSTDGDGEA